MSSPLQKKSPFTLGSCFLIVAVWFIVFFFGIRGALFYHQKTMWRDYSKGQAEFFTFALINSPQGELIPVSFAELKQNKNHQLSSFQIPSHFLGRSDQLWQTTSQFLINNNFHFGELSSVTLTKLGHSTNESTYQIEVHFFGGAQLIWKYLVTNSSITPLRWYEIHDTAGLSLLPVVFIIWLFASPFAVYLTILISRKRKSLKTSVFQ